MKKLILIFAVVLLFALTGCQKPVEEEENHDSEIASEIATWVPSQIPEATLTDITLPTTNPDLGGTITWESLDEDLITSEGIVVSSGVAEDAALEFTVTVGEAKYVDLVIVKVGGIGLDEVATAFTNQFSAIITRNYTVNTEFSNGYSITWTSSHPEAFSNEGVYNRPIEDTIIQINFTVSFGQSSATFTHEVKVQGVLLSTKVAEIKTWITNNYLPERLVQEEITLPSEYSKYRAAISWRSSNYNVIDRLGQVTRYGFDRYVTLTAIIQIDDAYAETDFSLVVAKKTFATQQEKIDSFLNAIAVDELPKVTFQYYSYITQSYNSLPFFDAFETTIVQQIAPIGVYGRTQRKFTSIEFITIHDTAGESAGANAKAHANLIDSGWQASWHYAVDQDGAYQSIPLDEVAWHAGDGSSVAFGLHDTGVLATVKYPVLTITDDHYYALNGEKSVIRAPKTSDTTYATTSQLTQFGVYTEIGTNGNYFINNSYFNDSYGRVSNRGGNLNSIGFETCVNYGSDYVRTFRNTANITSDLLIANNLSVDRVMQHNNFSGKDCPLSIRRTGYWNNFLDMVSLMKYGKENFQNYTFTWSTQSSSLQANGLVSRTAQTGETVNYSVEIVSKTNPLETYSANFSTLLG